MHKTVQTVYMYLNHIRAFFFLLLDRYNAVGSAVYHNLQRFQEEIFKMVT